MGLFSRKQPEIIATGAEIDAAARAIANNDSGPADRLCDRAGADSQRVAMAILARSVDYTPQED
ncbi:hypothetical protein ACFC0S_16860 [Streptomyces sp. NPDC056084]|uniref:hypothetical protein n=1 Tax=unclassified Streptomyces TaxID=2593676 RepID=UPI0035E2B48E